jgi:Ca2+-binding RTX toxin-like protein
MASHATGSSEILVNAYTSGSQSFPSVATLSDGGWVVTLTSDSQDGFGDGIYQQRYDADGLRVGSERQVNTHTTNGQNNCSVAGLADGGWLVTWESAVQDGEGSGIYQQRYAADGRNTGSETQINSYTTDNQDFPSVTGLADGGWLVVWRSHGQDGDGYGMYQQRYGADGVRIDGETLVNNYTTNQQYNSSVTALSDGGWLVTWDSNDQDGDGYGIYQQRYDSAGHEVGGENQVSSYTTSQQADPAVAALNDGGWLVTWDSYGQDGDSGGIFQQRYDAAGAKVGGEGQVNTYTTAQQYLPTATALADGGWLVTWTSDGQDGDDSGIYQQRYGANGGKVGGETAVDIETSQYQFFSSVTAFADGGWVVAWGSYAQDGYGYGIYQRHFAADIVGSKRADRLVGTNWDEYLVGNAGNDRLNGHGGDDVMVGGEGNDTYVVNSKSDTVQELATQGTDTVFTSISLSLERLANVENLTLTGSANLNANGNNAANALTGNSHSNVLKGMAGADTLDGGRGKDILYGGSGADRFVFRASTGHDTIRDFDFSGRDHDIVDIRSLTAIGNYADLRAHHMSEHGNSVVIDDLHGDVITLEGVAIRQLRAADFLV